MSGAAWKTPPDAPQDAAELTERDLEVVWGGDHVRRAAWARGLLQRRAAQTGRALAREDLRYAVVGPARRLVVIWPQAGETLVIGSDQTFLAEEGTGADPRIVEAYEAGERTTLAQYAPPSPEESRARQDAMALGPELAADAGMTLWPPKPGVLLDIGDQEISWRLCEEEGGFVAYFVSRGTQRELARGPELAPVLAEYRRSLAR